MTGEIDSFGSLLRAARRRAGFSTLDQFANYLASLGITYTNEALGHWENDRRTPERKVLLRVLGALAGAGGIRDLHEVNRMLWLLGWRDISQQERVDYFPHILATGEADNLPARPFDRLVGRDRIIDEVMARLADPAGRSIFVLSGLGGIGKTAIAYEMAQRLLSVGAFTKLAWETARSEEFVGVEVKTRRTTSPEWGGVLISMARQLGHDDLLSLPLSELEKALGRILRSENMLVVLDNLESLQAVGEVAERLYRMVSPASGADSSKVLITSRESLVDQTYVTDHFVDGLDEPGTLELLDLEAGTRGVNAMLSNLQAVA